MKVLNLYAGIGGNRKLWTDVDVTAVEINPDIAKIYKDFFPNDNVIVTDAHQYLLDHFKEFDFIWGSPPCPSHSRMRYMITKRIMGNAGYDQPIIYPDMKLYQEILLLQNYFEGLFVIENVKSYYIPLIMPIEIGRHYFWANFKMNRIKTNLKIKRGISIKQQIKEVGFDISKYSKIRKDTILRNCVEPELGLHILEYALGIIKSQDILQKTIFDL
jgi:DNA (cytosine-5)-methyltransferase 1